MKITHFVIIFAESTELFASENSIILQKSHARNGPLKSIPGKITTRTKF
jgi:hypothetical protein